MPLLTLSEERRRVEQRRAEHGEWLGRQERRQGYVVGGVMAGSILVQYLLAGLAMHLVGDDAMVCFYVALLLGPMPLVLVVAWRTRRD